MQGTINTDDLYKMNTTGSKENWNEQKEKLKRKFAIITGNDLMFEEGGKEEMIEKLREKLGKTREEMYRIITEI